MVLTLANSALYEIDTGGSRPIWMAEMYLGAVAYLRVLNYAAAAGQSFTLTVNFSGGPYVGTFTEGVQFSAGADNEETAENIAAAVNSDLTLTHRASAYAFQSMVVIHGYALDTRAQATSPVTSMSLTTSASAVWTPSVDPVDQVYRFISADANEVDDANTVLFIPEITSISGISAEIDPVTREFSIGDIEIEFADPNQQSVIRSLLYRTFPKGRYVKLWLGFPNIAYTSWLPVGGFVIDEVIPSRGAITITCAELTSVFRDSSFDNRYGPTPTIATPVSNSGMAGTGWSVTIEVLYGTSSREVRTYTEGTDFTGVDGDSYTTLINLAAAINADTNINTRVCAVYNGIVSNGNSRLYVFPIAAAGTSPAAFETRTRKLYVYGESPMQFGEVWSTFSYAGFLGSGFGVDPLGVTAPGFVNIHPIHGLREVLRHVRINADIVEEDTFDPAEYPTIGHYAVSATNLHTDELSKDNSIGLGSDCASLVERLCKFVQGSIVTTEEGKFKFIRRDIDKAVTRHLTTDDYEEFEWQQQFQNTINKVSVYGTAFGSDQQVQLSVANESFSIAIHNSYIAQVAEETIEDDLLGAWRNVTGVFSDSATSWLITGAWVLGFCGCRTAMTSSSSIATNQGILDGTRNAYLLIWRPSEGDFEFVKVTAASPTTEHYFDLQTHTSSTAYRLYQNGTGTANDPTLSGPLLVYDDWTLTVERGQLGTVAIDFTTTALGNRVLVADATIAKGIVDHYMSFGFGLPIASFRTSLRHYDLQLGDVITHDNQDYLNFLADGADSNTTWEIIGKEIDFPWVRFTVARLSSQFRPSLILSTEYEPPTDVVSAESGGGDVVTDNDLITVTDNTYAVVTRG